MNIRENRSDFVLFNAKSDYASNEIRFITGERGVLLYRVVNSKSRRFSNRRTKYKAA